MYIYPSLFRGFGGSWMQRQHDRRQLAARRCRRCKWYVDTLTAYAPPAVRNWNWPDIADAFSQGTVGDLHRRPFLGRGDQQPGEVEGRRQDRLRALAEGPERQARDVDLELGLPDQRRADRASAKKATWLFIEWAASAETQARTSWKFAGPAKRSGVNRMSLWQSPEFAAAMKDAGDNFIPAALESLEQDTDVDWRPRVPQWPAIGETMATAIQAALVGQKKPKEALDEAQARIDAASCKG